MKPHSAPSGLPPTFAFRFSTTWTSEQALAVVELLDELREKIWARYELQLMELIREDRRPPAHDTHDAEPDDPPF